MVADTSDDNLRKSALDLRISALERLFHMERLWAPWRIRYIRSKRQAKCLFCQAKNKPRPNFVILKTRYSIAMLNIFPYNNGHIMVAPLKHLKNLEQLNKYQIQDLFEALLKIKRLIRSVLRPDGYNIGINISEYAGAGIPDHLHIHIVPRWKGDTNFMPVFSGTKVISQSLNELYRQLKNAQAKPHRRTGR